jgi:hypothetical protein
MGRHNDSGRNHPRGKATVCRPCNENKSARSLAEFLPIRALVGTYRPTDCADHARIQP